MLGVAQYVKKCRTKEFPLLCGNTIEDEYSSCASSSSTDKENRGDPKNEGRFCPYSILSADLRLSDDDDDDGDDSSNSGTVGIAEAAAFDFTVSDSAENDSFVSNHYFRNADSAEREENTDKFFYQVGSGSADDAYHKLNALLKKSSVFAEMIVGRMKRERENFVTATPRKPAQTDITSTNKEDREIIGNTKVTRRSTRLQQRTKQISFALLKRGKRKICLPQRKIAAKKRKIEFSGEKSYVVAKPEKFPGELIPVLKMWSNTEMSIEDELKYFTGGKLRDYQTEGYRWLKAQYDEGINCILADEMGLGKTIQCIALFAQFYAKRLTGPFLIVAPLSTLPNWYNEFRRFAPLLPIIFYYGLKDQRAKLRWRISKGCHLDFFSVKPVVITSYELIIKDRPMLSKFQWRYMVVDEGHRVKNNKCKLINELRRFNSCSRLLMTGTPLQNNLAELWSLLNFLLPDVFNDLEWFESFFAFESINRQKNSSARQEIFDKEREREILSKLHGILKPFLLRRVKADVELTVPPKKELWLYAPMTTTQMKYYKAAVEKCIMEYCGTAKKAFNDVTGKRRSVLRPETLQFNNKSEIQLKSPSFEQHLNGVRNILSMLRQICLHPYLIEYPLTQDLQYLIDENLITKSGKLLVFDRLVRALIARKHKILVFSQFTTMLDILQDYCYLRNLDFCRLQGTLSLDERKIQIDKFNENPDVLLFLISTRAGGLGLNLTAADTVIVFDSDWNPQGDLQAQDRCHRIGQSKPVNVYRLICKSTIDEKIVERAAAKRRLEKMVIFAGDYHFSPLSSAQRPFSIEELNQLLKSTDYNQIWEVDISSSTTDCSVGASACPLPMVINDSDLEILLDRSQNQTTLRRHHQEHTDNLFKIVEAE